MSTFRSSVKAAQSELGEENPLRTAFVARWPNLADVLFGFPLQEDGNLWAPCYTVMIFSEGSTLKFILNNRDKDEAAFGTLAEPLMGFDTLEASLSSGAFSWRSTGKKKRS